MSPALLRRPTSCVSDLKLDRWLLGETPGSDEARTLEVHLSECDECRSRVRALKGVYQQVPHQRAVSPAPAVESPPAELPEPDGVMQVVILRDGLLVGSEVFTPGSYAIGCDRRAALRLEGGVAPLHARLYFRGGRVTVEDAGGGLYVNGFKARGCEVRPIDEVACGPYQLRARVIFDRWNELLPLERKRAARTVATPLRRLQVVEAPPPLAEPATEVVRALEPAPLDLRLTLVLSWGLSRQHARAFDGEVSARDDSFPLWGFDLADSFVLAERGARSFRLFVPPKATVTRHRGGRSQAVLDNELGRDGDRRFLELFSGETATLTEGVMSVEARVAPASARGPSFDLSSIPWGVVCMAALLLVGVGALSLTAPPERDSFEVKPLPRIAILVLPPAPKPPPTPQPTDAHGPKTPPKTPRGPVAAPHPHPTAPNPILARLLDPRSAPDLLFKNLGKPGHQGFGKRSYASLQPGLTSATGGGLELGISAEGGARGGRTMGIGGAGVLARRGTGLGGVLGQVHARPGAGAFRPSAPTSSIDKDAVAKVINAHLGEISSCYERSLRQHDGLAGTLSLEWAISTSGAVTGARVKSGTMRDAGVAGCIIDVLKHLQFPQARGGQVVVSYPFMFQASSF